MISADSRQLTRESKKQMNWNFDNWIRQLTLSALLLAALALVALAIALYAPRAHAKESTDCTYSSSEREQR
jgi:hypothetical protein